MDSPLVAWQGEVMLIGADWKHNDGHTARFLLDTGDDEPHPMAEHTVRRGKQAGARFMMVLVELSDDDTPVDQKARERVEENLKGDAVARNAGRMCASDSFQQFAKTLGFDESEAGAKALVYSYCGIASRKELDHRYEAQVSYERLRGQYLRWLNGDG